MTAKSRHERYTPRFDGFHTPPPRPADAGDPVAAWIGEARRVWRRREVVGVEAYRTRQAWHKGVTEKHRQARKGKVGA